MLAIPNIEIKFMVKIDNILESVLLNVTIFSTFNECKKMLENILNENDINHQNNIINKISCINLKCKKDLNESIGLYLLELINEEIMFTNE